MRLPRLLLRSPLLCTLLLAVSASLASAAHMAPVLPLSSSPNHSHEKFSPTVFPAGAYSNFDFSFADLTNCAFPAGTNLSGASFRGANLSFATFAAGCNLDQADFRGANLTNASLPCMGGADFRGAILTGVVGGGTGCGGCGLFGSNLTDNCTTAPLPSLCFTTSAFRGLVAGVVFADLNLNGTLDFGEPGVPGASVNLPAIPFGTPTDSRGAYFAFATTQAVGTVSVTLPVGWTLSGPAVQNYNLATCRSAQGLNFPATSQVVPALRSTFSRVKSIYR